MISHKIGIYDAKATGKNIQRLINELLDSNISLSEIKTFSESVTFRVFHTDIRRLRRVCKKLGCELELKNKRGLVVYAKKYGRHYGIYAGIIFSILLLSFFSNHILQVKVIGGDKETREAVNAVLEDYDISFGSFIPGIDFHEIETALTLETDCIAWAGIRSHGSTLVINISPVKQSPPMTQKRMPANIISTKSAIITDVQVYSGKLDVMIGDAVAEGQILISGEYQDINGDFCYRYSQADIYGTYSETKTFSQDFTTIEKQIMQNTGKTKSLTLFDSEIRFQKNPQYDNLIENKRTNYFSFLGIELPIGITYTSYDRYDYIKTELSEEEARQSVYDAISRYEENFLADVEIKDKKVKFTKDENGISASVSYILNGQIGQTQIFLPKKD